MRKVALHSMYKCFLVLSLSYSIDIQCFPPVTGDILSQSLIQIINLCLDSAAFSYALNLLS